MRNFGIIFIVICLIQWSASPLYAQREEINFNFGWKFQSGEQTNAASVTLNDSGWRRVDLPHDFQIEQEWTKKGGGQRGFKELTSGWYRKTFIADPAWMGRRVLLDFEGIMLYGDAYLNGKKVGSTNYGYLGFEADVTKLLNYEGDNVVAVYANTKGNSRWYTGGGLYRDVHVIVKDSISVARDGVYITTPEITEKEAKVAIRVELEIPSKRNQEILIQTRIFAPDGKLVAQTEAPAATQSKLPRVETNLITSVNNPQLWSCETPNLYKAEISIIQNGKVLDKVSETFGIRKIEFSPEFGFKLNGKKVILKGVADHHDLGAVGAAAHEFAIERMFKRLKEFGFNHIRCSHNPYSKSFFKLADKYGILIVDEAYDKWSNTAYWAGVERIKWTESVFHDIPEWIRRDRNHPSVIMWSLGNELQIREEWTGFEMNDWGVTTYKMLDVLVKRFDKTRPTTVAMFPAGANAVVEKNNKNFATVGAAELSLATEIASYNYLYKYFEAYRKANPELIIYQSEATTNKLGQPYFGMNLDTEVGLAYWGAVQYWGESNGWPRKGWTYSFFDHALEPFPQAYLMKSIFSEEPVVHIGVLDKEAENINWNEVTSGTQDVSDHWNREEGKICNIYTYTNADEVELVLNGKSLGIQKNNRTDIVQRNMIAWKNIPYAKGSLVAIAKNNGKEVARHTLETTGKAVALKIETENPSWKADGMDLQYVKVYAVDNRGRVVQTIENKEVTFEISGAARLIAVDNGDHSSDELFAGNKRKLNKGFAMAILRSTQTASEVIIKVRVEGLKTVEKKLYIK